MNSKEKIQKEIILIHKKYDEGIKDIKPSFNYIVVNLKNDDFIVTKTLQQAKEKAIEYATKEQEIFEIYEVQRYPDNTYRAVVIYSCCFADKQLYEIIEIHNCMHIAWRTRGDLLEALI